MAAVSQTMGANAAEGDLSQQTQRRTRNPWLKMLYQGVRAFINLMPDALQMNRAVNTMDLDQKDEDLIQFSVADIRSIEQHEHIKWGGLHPILDMFGSNYLEALDRYIPDMLPKKNWTASDSVLTIFNSGSPKDNRSWADEQWMDNKYVWERYITESVWAIKDSGQIEDIMAKLQQAMADDPEVRGDPSRFTDHLSFLTMQNENKYERNHFFEEASEFLGRFPVGTVSIFGPATSDIWWPDTVGSAGNAKWDKLSYLYFGIITKDNVHPWIRGSARLGNMELRRGVSAKGNP